MRLTEKERDVIRTAAEGLAGKSRVTALCAYGSKVAGYARSDSDYDFIVVLRGFREGVRYRYISQPIEGSALLVDQSLLERDARTSFLGEFVIGRFLNVYDPIEDPGLLKRLEVEYKRRVMVEGLFALASDCGEFTGELVIPYEYFLFDKLRKRAMIYPPALYSYVRTYSCKDAASNKESSVEGFKDAALALASKGFVVAEDSSLRVVPEKMKGDSFTKLLSIFSLTARGVTQYAVHGYAGRVGLSVFRKEAASKLKRMREDVEPLPALERPRSLLSLEEGLLIPEVSRLNSELAASAGLPDRYTVSEKNIGEPYTTTRVLTLGADGREVSFVVKNFSDIRSLKWALLGLWAAPIRKLSMTSGARLSREYSASINLREAGATTPKVIAVSPEERLMVKEFIEGTTLARVIDDIFRGDESGLRSVSEYGTMIGRVHSAGLTIGDTKASNVVVSDRGLYLTDLELSSEGGDFAWDVAEFVYYTAKLSRKNSTMEAVGRSFLEAYAKAADPRTIAAAGDQKYLRPFQPFLSPGMAKALKASFAEYS